MEIASSDKRKRKERIKEAMGRDRISSVKAARPYVSQIGQIQTMMQNDESRNEGKSEV
jgi:hypothetical protein